MDTVSFTLAGAETLSLPLSPISFPFKRSPDVSVAVARTAGNVTYAYEKGLKSVKHILSWVADEYGRPSLIPGVETKLNGQLLNPIEFDKDFNWDTMTQLAGTMSLVGWFYTIAVGPLNTFTYTDPFGVAHTVRFEEVNLNVFEQQRNGLWTGTLTLVEEL